MPTTASDDPRNLTSGRRPKVGVEQASDKIWLVSYMQYDLGYFDHETYSCFADHTKFLYLGRSELVYANTDGYIGDKRNICSPDTASHQKRKILPQKGRFHVCDGALLLHSKQ